jgi:hypothetical protein
LYLYIRNNCPTIKNIFSTNNENLQPNIIAKMIENYVDEINKSSEEGGSIPSI